MKSPQEKGIIQSVDRALTLLEVLEDTQKESLSLPEITAKAGGDPSTIHRQLKTLVVHGLVNQDPFNKRYSLGSGLLRLSHSLYKKLRIQSILHPYLIELTQTTGETTHLAVLSGDRAVFIDRIPGSEIVTVNTEVGDSEPLHCTAVGKALLSFQVERVREGFVQSLSLHRFTPNTIVKRASLKEEIERTRKHCIAYDDEEFVSGVRCCAAPVFNIRDELVCVVGISSPATRTNRRRMEELGRSARRLAYEASRHLGSDGRRFPESS